MNHGDDEERLDHLLRAIDAATILIGRGRAAFDADDLLQRAAKNIVTEVGEAAKGLTARFTEATSDIPWKEAKGMRDVTVHRYWAVETDTLWMTLTDDLPMLGTMIRAHLEGRG